MLEYDPPVLEIMTISDTFVTLLNYPYRNLWRTTNEEKRALEREKFDQYNEVRRAAEVHRQVRQYARRTIKPGMSMIEIVEMIENGTRNLVEANGFESAMCARLTLVSTLMVQLHWIYYLCRQDA